MRSFDARSWFLPQLNTLRRILTLLVASGLAACNSGYDAASALAPGITQVPSAPTPVPNGPATVTGTLYKVDGNSAFHVHGLQIILPPEAAGLESIVAGSYVRVTGSVHDHVLDATEIIVLGEGPSYRLVGQVDAIDPGRRTLHVLGIDVFWRTETSGTPAEVRIGDWVTVQAHGNHFVQSVDIRNAGNSVIEGEWIRDPSPPIGFTLGSGFDFLVQVTPTATLGESYFLFDGDCYGWDLLSSDEFFRRMSEPRPTGYTVVHAEGRFEGGILIADLVWFCHE